MHTTFTPTRRAPSPTDLPTVMADACRRVARSAVGLTPDERQLLRDFTRAARGDVRYPLIALQRVLQIAAKCGASEDRHAVDEAVRGYVLAHTQARPVSLADTFLHEERSNHVANVWQQRYLYERSDAARDGLIEGMAAQESASRVVLDAVHVERAHQSRALILVP